jgi:hypothetical protein
MMMMMQHQGGSIKLGGITSNQAPRQLSVCEPHQVALVERRPAAGDEACASRAAACSGSARPCSMLHAPG